MSVMRDDVRKHGKITAKIGKDAADKVLELAWKLDEATDVSKLMGSLVMPA